MQLIMYSHPDQCTQKCTQNARKWKRSVVCWNYDGYYAIVCYLLLSSPPPKRTAWRADEVGKTPLPTIVIINSSRALEKSKLSLRVDSKRMYSISITISLCATRLPLAHFSSKSGFGYWRNHSINPKTESEPFSTENHWKICMCTRKTCI